MKSLKIGVVGAGSIFLQRHLPGLRAIPGVEIVAVANSTKASAAAFCNSHLPEAEPMDNWEVLVARSDLDIVWNCTTPHLHEPVTVAALRAGHHVFCQARMARTLDEALRMVRESRKHPNLVTALCPAPFALAEDAVLREILANKLIGEIHHLRLRSLNGAFADPSAPLHWRQRRDLSGNNVLTLGIFVEVLQRHFGDIRSVSAHGAVRIKERPGGPVEIPDVLDVIASFENGILSTWHFSGIHTGPPVNDLELVGDAGLLHMDFDSGRIMLERMDGSKKELHPGAPGLKPWSVEADFIRAVRDPSAPRPRPDFHDGIAYMRVVDAVREACDSGRTIQLAIPNAGLPEL
jgi:predicted dehydrogenase